MQTIEAAPSGRGQRVFIADVCHDSEPLYTLEMLPPRLILIVPKSSKARSASTTPLTRMLGIPIDLDDVHLVVVEQKHLLRLAPQRLGLRPNSN